MAKSEFRTEHAAVDDISLKLGEGHRSRRLQASGLQPVLLCGPDCFDNFCVVADVDHASDEVVFNALAALLCEGAPAAKLRTCRNEERDLPDSKEQSEFWCVGLQA